MVIFFLTLAAVPFVLPFVAIAMARSARTRVTALEAKVAEQDRAIELLQRRLTARSAADTRPAATHDAVTVPAAAPVVTVRPPVVPPIPARADATATPTPAAEAPSPAPPRPPAAATPPQPEPSPAARPDSPAARPASTSPPTRPSPRPAPEPEHTPEPAAPGWLAAAFQSFDWESLVGVRLFSAVAGLALAISGLLFVRYSIDQGWLQPPVRMAIGILVAISLLVVCERKAARRYPLTANALDGAAIAILFSTFFAAHALWHLIGATVAFALLALVTVVAVLLSIRRDSLFIAVLGLLGGFATPALVSTGENRPVALFSYLLLLNLGLAWVAPRRRWPWLSTGALALTTLYQWGWVGTYLTGAQLPLAYGIFALFPLARLASTQVFGTADDDEQHEQIETWTTTASAVMPLLFLLYVAATPSLAQYFHLLFGATWLAMVGLSVVATLRGPKDLQVAAHLAAIVVWLAWAGGGGASIAWPTALAWLGLFVVTVLALPEWAERRGTPHEGVAAFTDVAAPAMLAVTWPLARTSGAEAAPWLLFGTIAALLLLVATRAVVRERGPIYFAAVLVAVVAEGLWIGRFLSPDRLGTAVAIMTTFIAVFIAVPLVARRRDRTLAPEAGSGVVLIAAILLLSLIANGPVAPAALWGLGLLLAGLNVALVIESAAARLPLLSWVGGLASWGVLALWWSDSAAAVPLLPALTVILLLALVMMAGMIWARRGVPGDPMRRLEAEGFTAGPTLAVGGHLFLVAVALRQELAVPPWPLFGVLGVLTMGLTVTAVALRRPVFHGAGVVAALGVLAIWTGTATVAPWPMVAWSAAAILGGYSLAALVLGRRDAAAMPALAVSAGVALAIVHVLLMRLTVIADAPAFGWLLGLHLAAIVAVLWLSAWQRWAGVPLGLVASAWLAAGVWQQQHPDDWRGLLVMAVWCYGCFVAYGFRQVAQRDAARDSYLTPVVAAVPAFFLARHAFDVGQLSHVVGVVPVTLAAVLAVFLRRVLAITPPGGGDLARTATVAGAALAFVTLAIPLQLETKWITVGWALEGAALAWLWTRVAHRGLLWWSMGLLTTVFVRLVLNPEVFGYEPRGQRILNWYLYVYVVAAAAMFLAAKWTPVRDDRLLPGRLAVRATTLLAAGGAVLLFWLLNIEIADFYSDGPRIVFRFGASVSQDLTYTVGWLAFGLALLVVGIVRHHRPTRLASLALLTVTIVKCFLYDLSRLEGLFRVGSFVGLALSLVLVSLAIQRFVLAAPARAEQS